MLVADDTAFVRDRFKAAIEGAGHKALTAQNGPELLGRIRADARDLDLIVLDPPSLAKREAERARAIGAYRQLNADGLRWLAPGGVLVAASCSAHVSPEEFFGAVRQAARESARPFAEWETTGHPPDHPATFSEAQYLKAIYLRFR